MSKDRFIVSAAYGRCLEGWQRSQAEIDFRLSQLKASAASQAEIDNDIDLIALLGDRRDWEKLIRETPAFVEFHA